MRLPFILILVVAPLFTSANNHEEYDEKCTLSTSAKNELDSVKALIDHLQSLVTLLVGPIGEDCEGIQCEPASCPTEIQITIPGECCPSCSNDPCLLAPPCAPLMCSEAVQIRDEGECCPRCPDCDTVCALFTAPVCGNDGKTYDNECRLNLAKCNRNPDLEVAYTGVCQDPCAGVACLPPLCINGFVLQTELSPGECCLGCIPDPDPCAGIQCDIPNCAPLGMIISYDEGCCPACVDPCADVTCDVPTCEEGYELGSLSPDQCCPGCTLIFRVQSLAAVLFGQAVRITWTPALPDTSVQGYLITVKDGEDETVFTAEALPTDIEYTVSGLDPSTFFNLSIVPIRRGGGYGAAVHFAFTTDPAEVVPTTTPPPVVYTDCSDAYTQGQTASGVYSIQPDSTMAAYMVYCDMDTDGGKWTTVLKRDGSTNIDFDVNFNEYAAGFGDHESEYFLGLEKFYRLLKAGNTFVRFDMTDFDGQAAHATFGRFLLEDRSNNYKLKTVAGYKGTAGNSLHFSKGMEFSTRDNDNDRDSGNCAAKLKSGGWFKSGVCTRFNIFGTYHSTPVSRPNKGMFWATFRDTRYSLATMEMKVRAP